MNMMPSMILGIAGVACGFAIDRARVANAPKPLGGLNDMIESFGGMGTLGLRRARERAGSVCRVFSFRFLPTFDIMALL